MGVTPPSEQPLQGSQADQEEGTGETIAPLLGIGAARCQLKSNAVWPFNLEIGHGAI